MDKSIEAMKLALEAFETELSIDWTNNDEFNASAEKMYEAITAIKEVLAEHAMQETQRLGQEIEQEPVGMVKDLFTHTAWEKLDVRGSTKVYLDIPPQPEQEPVAYFHPHKGFYWAKPTSISAPTIVDVEPLPLYTHPPRGQA